jgi:hypothetical protein
MDLGVGLPNAVAGTTGKQLTDWARAPLGLRERRLRRADHVPGVIGSGSSQPPR